MRNSRKPRAHKPKLIATHLEAQVVIVIVKNAAAIQQQPGLLVDRLLEVQTLYPAEDVGPKLRAGAEPRLANHPTRVSHGR